MDQNDYNNGTTVQLLCFLAAEFPVQLLIKRYGFKQVLPFLMMMWSLVSWTQAFMTNKVGFYITRALIGACEGGFIPGTSKSGCLELTWCSEINQYCSLVRNLLLHIKGAFRSAGGLLVDFERCTHYFIFACCWHS